VYRQGVPAATAEDHRVDTDSSESPTYGEQESSAYNGYFGCTCYHRLFVFNQFGDVAHSAAAISRILI
jgi:hypothetical protein